MSQRSLTLVAPLAFTLALALACGPAGFPWPRPMGPPPAALATHADVTTANPGYRRTSSRVLVRSIARPTRAALDWAAYHANFMNADLEPEDLAQASGAGRRPDASNPFKGALERASLTGSLRTTPLTEDERRRPFAFAPLVEYLAAKHGDAAAGLEEIAGAVRGEAWGLGGGAHLSRQLASEAFLHEPGGGRPTELWIKVELQPWFKAFPDAPDEDGDGVPELYGRARAELVSPAAVAAIRGDYAGRVLTPAEVKAWANQLSSYWYPSYNTDLVAAGPTWPDDAADRDAVAELGGRTFAAPTIVLRGRPQGAATYNVFLVGGDGANAATAGEKRKEASEGAGATTLKLPAGKAAPQVAPIEAAIKQELATEGGGYWQKWAAAVQPFHDAVKKRLKTQPAQVKGLPGADGFLLFRNSLEYLTGGDLGAQKKGKNPLPVIVEWKELLAKHGVDFLFVPVPTKEEIFPDKVDPAHKQLVGRVVNPWQRKLLLDLAQAGVEALDLLPAFLAERGRDAAAKEPLYQVQDTHWTSRGLELAARLLAERVKKYAWSRHLPRQVFSVKEAPFTRFGDLHSRLPGPLRARYRPEALVGRQVLGPSGALYEDDATSPIIVLGDSFTGVYELTDCQSAGVSAHLARELGTPVDLVMSYGGGPNVRQKLMRRGVEDLSNRRLIIWMMTARDLYNYWEEWAPIAQR
jgi:alginate O-acetyltransferase complex protein AlgJ